VSRIVQAQGLAFTTKIAEHAGLRYSAFCCCSTLREVQKGHPT